MRRRSQSQHILLGAGAGAGTGAESVQNSYGSASLALRESKQTFDTLFALTVNSEPDVQFAVPAFSAMCELSPPVREEKINDDIYTKERIYDERPSNKNDGKPKKRPETPISTLLQALR